MRLHPDIRWCWHWRCWRFSLCWYPGVMLGLFLGPLAARLYFGWRP